MPTRLLVTICLAMIGLSLFAQRRVYPVVVDHKIGFINIRGKLIKQTDYDYVSNDPMLYYDKGAEPGYSPYYLVEKNGALGLVDAYLEPILECRYLQIRVLTDDLFSVRTADGFNLLERGGDLLLDDYYSDFTIIGTNPGTRNKFILIRKGDTRQVYQLGKGLFGPDQLEYVRLEEGHTDLFVGMLTNGERVVFDTNGDILLKGVYEAIDAFNPYFFWVQRHNIDHREALNRSGRVLFTSKEVMLKPLCGNLVSVSRTGSRPVLFDAAQETTISGPADASGFFVFNWQYTQYSRGRMRGLLAPDGKIVLEPIYSNIQAFEDSLVLLTSNGTKRIWSPDRGLLGSKGYQDIDPFDEEYYTIREASGAGLIRRSDLTPVIPPQYESFQVDGNFIKAFTTTKTVDIFQQDAAGQWQKQKDFANVRTINLQGSYQIAKRLKSSSEAPRSDSLDTFVPLETVENRTYSFVYDKPIKAFRLQGPDVAGTRFGTEPVHKFRDVDLLGVSLTYAPRKVNAPPVRKLLRTTPDGLHALAWFRHRQNDWTTDYSYWGLRRHDYLRNLPYAAAYHLDGQFHLLDKQGKPKKGSDGEPLAFSYIGEFINGFARAAVGGQLSLLKDDLQRKYAIGPIEVFEERFEISRNDGKRVYNQSMWLNPGEDVRWGIIDTAGNWLVKPIYRFMKTQSGEQIVAQHPDNKRWGVISKDGQTIIDFKYAGIAGMDNYWRVVVPSKGLIFFNEKGHQIMTNNYRKRGRRSEGLLLVSKEGQYGFLDSLGQEAIPCRYEAASDFAEGRAAVKEHGQWKMVDRNGQVYELPGLEADTVMAFQGGLCAFRRGQKMGFLNHNLEVQINPNFPKVSNFRHGVARVWQGKHMGLIDTSGQVLIEPNTYHRIMPLDDNGLAVVEQRGRIIAKGLINHLGKTIVEPTYSFIGPFKDGRAVVRLGRKAGYIDTRGKLVIPLQYSAARDFSEGLAQVQATGRRYWQYITPEGKVAFPGDFYFATPFQSGQAIVRDSPNNQAPKKLINQQGQVVLRELPAYRFWSTDHIGLVNQAVNADRYVRYYYGDLDGLIYFDRYFQDVQPFTGDFAIVQDRWRKGVINRLGRYIIPPKYVLLEQEPDGSIKAGPPAFGLIDREGNTFVDPLYDRIIRMQGGLFRLERGEQVGYVNRKGAWVWEMGD